MNIKNYTSGISVENTIARIESKLSAAGANGIMKLYNHKQKITSMVFRIDLGNGQCWHIKVPAKVEACFDAMWKQHCLHHSRPREETKARIYEQAERTAWKLVQDWIEVQVSLIVMKQAEFLEVFMPYIWDGKETYFEQIQRGGYKALPEKTD